MTLALGFLAPANFFFLVLAGLPLLIHLFSRRRWRVVKWAAMEFLLRAMRKQRRRLRLENLLLILLRTAAIVCLVVACAQPVGRVEPLPLVQPSGTCWIFAFDTSYSMAYQDSGRSCLGSAAALVKSRVNSATQADRVVILKGAQFPDLLFDDHATEDGRLRASEVLDGIEVSAASLDVAALLGEVVRAVKRAAEEGLPAVVELYTDLQARDWLQEKRAARPEIRERLAALQNLNADLRIVDVGFSNRVNLGVVDLTLDRSLVATDVPVTVTVAIRNWSTIDVPDAVVDLLVDGHQKLGRGLNLPAGATRSVVFRQVFRRSGVHSISAVVRSDGLPLDNSRFLAVTVRKAVRVLLVDGSNASRAADRETFFLEAALQSDGEEAVQLLSPFRVRLVPLASFNPAVLGEIDVVILADCDRLGEIAALKRFLEGGGSAVFFLGPNVDLEFYNRELFDPEIGVCRLRLIGAAGDPQKRFGVRMEPVALDHPVMRYFIEREDVRLDSAPVWRFIRAHALKGTKVLASYKDPDRSPAIVESRIGRGTVVVITTTADEKWTNFPKWPDYVPFIHELLSYLVSERSTERNLLVGWPFRRRYPPAAFAREVRIRSPRGAVTRTSLRALEQGGDFMLLFEKTLEPGIYEVKLLRQRRLGAELAERFPDSELFAVNVESSEGDLTPASEPSLRAAYGSVLPRIVYPGDTLFEPTKQAGPARADLWRPFLYAVLLLFVAEAVCATLFGRRQR